MTMTSRYLEDSSTCRILKIVGCILKGSYVKKGHIELPITESMYVYTYLEKKRRF